MQKRDFCTVRIKSTIFSSLSLPPSQAYLDALISHTRDINNFFYEAQYAIGAHSPLYTRSLNYKIVANWLLPTIALQIAAQYRCIRCVWQTMMHFSFFAQRFTLIDFRISHSHIRIVKLMVSRAKKYHIFKNNSEELMAVKILKNVPRLHYVIVSLHFAAVVVVQQLL